MMFLDISKKPGDPNAVVTEEQLLEENEKLKEENARLRKCNAVVIREALEGLMKWFDCEMNGHEAEELEDAIDKARAALDAPARNCDKFASNEVIAARMAFDKYCLGRHCGECPHLQYVNIHNCWIAWFLAKAEGANK